MALEVEAQAEEGKQKDQEDRGDFQASAKWIPVFDDCNSSSDHSLHHVLSTVVVEGPMDP